MMVTNYFELEIDIKNFKKGKRINKGGFGTVYEAIEEKTGELYAAKVIDCNDDKEECKKMIEREINIMLASNHPTVIKFYGYSLTDFHEEPNVTIIMKFAQNGSLDYVLKNIKSGNTPPNYTNTSRQIIIIGIARGIKYLHDRNIIHRDIKTGNILLDEKFHPFITDFGLSKFFISGHSKNQSIFLGTLIYMAPEIFDGEDYDTKADIYAFGIIMYEVVTDLVPYPVLVNKKLNEFQFGNSITNKNLRPHFKDPVKSKIQELIQQCWLKNPNDRPNINEVFIKLTQKEYFLEGVDEKTVQQYVEDINKVTDPIEELLQKNEKLEKENKEIKLKIFESEQIEKQNQELKREIQELKNEIQKLKNQNNGKKSSEANQEEIEEENEEKEFKDHFDPTVSLCKNDECLDSLKNDGEDEVEDDNKDDDVVNDDDSNTSKYCNEHNEAEVKKQFDSISFLGKSNKCFLSLQNDVVSLDVDSKNNQVIKVKNRDFIKQSIEGHQCDVWTHVGRINENSNLLKEIMNSKLIIFGFNLAKPSTLEYLTETIKPIIENDEEKEEELETQERILVGIFPKSSTEGLNLVKTYKKLPNTMKMLKCTKYFEYGNSKKVIKPKKRPVEINRKLISYLYEHVPSIKEDEMIEEEQSEDIFQEISINDCSIKSDQSYFSNSVDLKNINFTSERISINERCFENCSSISSISFPNAVEVTFKPYSFSGCRNLKQISIPKADQITFGAFCFNEATNFASIELTSNHLTFDDFCFQSCSSLKTFSINKIQNAVFNQSIFKGCTNLEHISISKSLSLNLGQSCFSDLNKLDSFEIESDVISFSSQFLSNCPSLTSIKIESKQPIELKSDLFLGNHSIRFIEINSFTSIKLSESCFSNSKGIETVKFKSNQTILDKQCFSSSTKLRNVEIESNDIQIQNECFKNCTELNEISFNNVQTIFVGSNAFEGYSKLKVINIFASYKINLFNYSFGFANSLKSITLDSKEIIIGDYCFRNCKVLKSIFFFDVENMTIGMNAFCECESINNIDISVSNELNIADYCFNGSPNLKSVSLKGGCLNIGKLIFKNCPSIKTATFESERNFSFDRDAFSQSPNEFKPDLSKLKKKEIEKSSIK